MGESLGELLRQVQEQEPERPRVLNPKEDRDLETIALKCLEKDPRKRYGSAEEVAEELGRWLADKPILRRPVGRLERGWRWCKRNPVVAGLTGTVSILLVAAIVLSWGLTGWALGEREKARSGEQKAARTRRKRK